MKFGMKPTHYFALKQNERSGENKSKIQRHAHFVQFFFHSRTFLLSRVGVLKIILRKFYEHLI